MPPKSRSRASRKSRTRASRSRKSRASRTRASRSRKSRASRTRASRSRKSRASRTRASRSRKSRTRRAREFIKGWEDADKEGAREELSRATELISRVSPEDRNLAKKIASKIYSVLVHTVPTWVARIISLPFAVSLLIVAASMGRNLFSAAVLGQALRLNSWWLPTRFKKILYDSIVRIRTDASLVGALEKYMYLRGFDEMEGGGDGIYIQEWGGYKYGDAYE